MYKQFNMFIIILKKFECERVFFIWIIFFVRFDIFLNVKNVSMLIFVKRQFYVDIQQYKYNLIEYIVYVIDNKQDKKIYFRII